MNSRLAVIRTIFQTKDINRVVLAEKLGLSGAAITKIINPIVQQGFVEDLPYYSKIRGRRARYLSIKAQRNYVVCIRIVRKGLYCALVDVAGRIMYREYHPVSMKQLEIASITSSIDSLLQKSDKNMSCLGCVILSPGVSFDGYDKQSLFTRPFYWDAEPFNQQITEKFGIPTYWENASNAALLGEVWFGSAKKASSVVLYNIGEGIGAAAYSDGLLHRGYLKSAVEIGHITIDEKGPQCPCGNHGCLELYASTKVWETRYNGHDADPSFSELFALATQKEENALKVIRNYAQVVTSGLLILATMFAPELLIVTANEAPYIRLPLLCDIMRESLTKRIYSYNQSSGITLNASDLGEDGFLLGSIPIALDYYFS